MFSSRRRHNSVTGQQQPAARDSYKPSSSTEPPPQGGPLYIIAKVVEGVSALLKSKGAFLAKVHEGTTTA